MNKNLPVPLLCFLFISSAQIYPQEVKVTDAGKFTASLNGKELTNPIRFGESDELVSIATGDETYTLTINFNNAATISEIKTGETKLPAKDNSVTVLYLDNSMQMPSIVTAGTLTITDNNEKVLKGNLEFTASAGGIPKEMGGMEIKLSKGSFEIPK